jgi:hypothetical protein
VPCLVENPVYFSQIGDSEIFLIAVDTSGQAGTALVESVVFEDINHHGIGFTAVTTLSNDGLNVTFGFVVPAAALDVRFIRVSVQISFNTGGSADFNTQKFVVLTTQKTYVAQSRFEISEDSAAVALRHAFAVLCVMMALVWLVML